MVPSRTGTGGPAQGAGRIMFRPVMAQRRRTPGPAEMPKKETVAQEPLAQPAQRPPTRGRGRTSAARSQPEMSASGPFALGPIEHGRARATAPRPVAPLVTAPGAAPEQQTTDDDGINFIDMRRVQDLDAMAPQSLLELPRDKVKEEVKAEGAENSTAQALDLSDSEPEDDEADIARRFTSTLESGHSDQNVFLFQFPQVFPQFSAVPSDLQAKNEDGVEPEVVDAGIAPSPAPEGQIGQLNIHADGRAVLMVGDVPFELSDGCEVSFLQQLMMLDPERQQAVCMGELDNKFVATPQLEYLLREDEARMHALGS